MQALLLSSYWTFFMSLESLCLALRVMLIQTLALEILLLPNTGPILACGTGRCSTLSSISWICKHWPHCPYACFCLLVRINYEILILPQMGLYWCKCYFSTSRWSIMRSLGQTSVSIIFNWVLHKSKSASSHFNDNLWNARSNTCIEFAYLVGVIHIIVICVPVCWFRDMEKGQMILFPVSQMDLIHANMATWILQSIMCPKQGQIYWTISGISQKRSTQWQVYQKFDNVPFLFLLMKSFLKWPQNLR